MKHGPFESDLASEHLNFYYGNKQALKDVSLNVEKNKITALIGPSGCGKTTFLRCFNRMHDLYKGNRYEGRILFKGKNILEKGTDLAALRGQIGMVFQKPTPFPMSVFDNVAYGAALWEEVETRLNGSAMGLSGGQQQRLSIARTLAPEPDVVLFDEPTSALDPISTAKIEDLMRELRGQMTMIIVTHNMQQAARISDWTVFMYMGELIETDKTDKIFTAPSVKMTEEYITGQFG